MNKTLSSMTQLEIEERLTAIAELNDYVYVEDIHTKDADIFGSDASYSALKMAGGKIYIVPSFEIKSDNIVVGDDTLFSVRRLARDIFEYFN